MEQSEKPVGELLSECVADLQGSLATLQKEHAAFAEEMLKHQRRLLHDVEAMRKSSSPRHGDSPHRAQQLLSPLGGILYGGAHFAHHPCPPCPADPPSPLPVASTLKDRRLSHLSKSNTTPLTTTNLRDAGLGGAAALDGKRRTPRTEQVKDEKKDRKTSEDTDNDADNPAGSESIADCCSSEEAHKADAVPLPGTADSDDDIFSSDQDLEPTPKTNGTHLKSAASSSSLVTLDNDHGDHGDDPDGMKGRRSSALVSRKSMLASATDFLRSHGTKKNSKLKKSRASQFIMTRRLQEFEAAESNIQRLVNSKWFEWLSIAFVVANSFFIGYQVEYIAARAEEGYKKGAAFDTGPPAALQVVQYVFCVVFLVELLLRWRSDGLFDFLRGTSVAWNMFDIFIVAVGCIEILLESISPGSAGASFSVVRVLRVLRIAKVVRVIRVMKFFHELRIMIDSIIGSLKVFTWSMIVLFMLFYVFGIGITSGVTDFLSSYVDDGILPDELTADDVVLLSAFFGRLDSSMHSLFTAMSGGRDWVEYYDVLRLLPIWYRLLFLLFISFSVFAVVNVVTGVFVESAIQTSGSDKEAIIKEELDSKFRYLQNMQEVFMEMDADGTGGITLDEFQEHLGDQRVIAYFNSLKLDVSDATMLFRLLDSDNSGSVDVEEFLDGCQRLKGEARSLDIASLKLELENTRKNLFELADFLGNKHYRFMSEHT
eukprot:TRINITY_DN27239_c0_g2_i1.p1 TRINITY_DN27239_c0_g2~~TRINITY_DN27239_c0_g2_i1.p1  ORF type:complete len:712 (-),score=180.93 TRINITY_DN27239_c0_g2_i1:330-2465(-)